MRWGQQRGSESTGRGEAFSSFLVEGVWGKRWECGARGRGARGRKSAECGARGRCGERERDASLFLLGRVERQGLGLEGGIGGVCVVG